MVVVVVEVEGDPSEVEAEAEAEALRSGCGAGRRHRTVPTRCPRTSRRCKSCTHTFVRPLVAIPGAPQHHKLVRPSRSISAIARHATGPDWERLREVWVHYAIAVVEPHLPVAARARHLRLDCDVRQVVAVHVADHGSRVAYPSLGPRPGPPGKDRPVPFQTLRALFVCTTISGTPSPSRSARAGALS